MSSSATDVETPAKGRWFVSTITTSTSDASPVKVGGTVSQLPSQIPGHILTPRTCHRAGRTNKHRQLRYLQRPKKILLKLVIRILSSAAWHETEGRVRDVVGYKVGEGAWRPWSGSADPEGKWQSCKLTLHI